MESRQLVEHYMNAAGVAPGHVRDFFLRIRGAITWGKDANGTFSKAPKVLSQQQAEDIDKELQSLTNDERAKVHLIMESNRLLGSFRGLLLTVEKELRAKAQKTFGTFVVSQRVSSAPPAVPPVSAPPLKNADSVVPPSKNKPKTHFHSTAEAGEVLAEWFNTAKAIEPNYAEALGALERNVRIHIDHVRHIHDIARDLPAGNIQELKSCCNLLPRDLMEPICELREQTQIISRGVFGDLQPAFAETHTDVEPKKFGPEHQKSLYSFLRFQALTAVHLYSINGVAFQQKQQPPLEKWYLKRAQSSVLQSNFLAFLRSQFPVLLEEVPRNHPRRDSVIQQRGLFMKDMEECIQNMKSQIMTSELEPAGAAWQQSLVSFRAFWNLHNLGLMTKRPRQPSVKKECMDIDMPPMHFVQEHCVVHKDVPVQDCKSATSWGFGPEHQLRHVFCKYGQDTFDGAVWMETPEGHACHTPETVIALREILPEDTCVRRISDLLENASSQNLHDFKLHLKSNSRDPQRKFSVLKEALRNESLPLILHDMNISGGGGVLKYLHWLLPDHLAKQFNIDMDIAGRGSDPSGDEQDLPFDDLPFIPPTVVGSYVLHQNPETLIPVTAEVREIPSKTSATEDALVLEQENLERVKTAMQALYSHTKELFTEPEVRRLLSVAKMEKVDRGRSSHHHVKGPGGEANFPQLKETKRHIIEEKIAAVGDIAAFEEWTALQTKPKGENGVKTGNGNGGGAQANGKH